MNSPTQLRAIPMGEDEIDLFELVRVLWDKKVVIAAITLLATLVAALYAFTAPQRWTSEAYVSAPRVEQIKAYLEQRRALARVDGTKAVDTVSLVKNLFTNFIDLSSTQQTKLDFLAGTQYYKDLTAGMDSGNAERLLVSLADRSLLVRPPGKDLISPYYTMSFTADNPKTAQSLLVAYVAAVNKKAFRLVDGEFGDSLNAGILSRQAELGDIEFRLKSDRESRILALQTALSTATRAGLKEYAVGRNAGGNTVVEVRDTSRLFMLGEKYLSAELVTAKESPLIFPSRYYEIKRELSLLEPLVKYQVAPSYGYNYQLSPTLPQKRDAPKRALIIVLGILMGGMLGCGWVLMREAARKYRIGHPPAGNRAQQLQSIAAKTV